MSEEQDTQSETPPQKPDTRYESVTLYSAGSIPGIPGEHAPGNYVIDWQERTISPAVDATSETETPEEAQPEQTQEEPATPVEPTQEDAMPEVVAVPDLAQETPAQESNQ